MTGPWLLALETSVTEATLALACEGQVIAEQSFHSERSQERDLFPPLQNLLGELPQGQTLATVIVGLGPGSYNGARVGIAAAQAVAQFHQAPVAGLCSFEGTPEALTHESVLAVGDARRGSFFTLPLINGRVRNPPRLLDQKEFLESLTDLSARPITFESPARLPEGSRAVESRPTARGLIQSWLGRTKEEQNSILSGTTEAFYLRPPHITKSRKPRAL